jgi:hypothetical protein
MQHQTTLQSRPIRVVLIDHSYLHLIGWAEKFAKSVVGIEVILVTDKSPSRVVGNLEVINVHDVAQNLDIDELQQKLNFSLYRTLITERAYFDYTSFTKRECYSRVNLDEIAKLICPYVNALDEVIRTRADLVFGYLADNTVVSFAAHIAEHYGKPYAAPSISYWSADGYFFRDRTDQTSSQVDALYSHYYANQSSIDRASIQEFYSTKRVSHQYSDIIVYSLPVRIKKILSSQRWHDPFSPINWLTRRCFRLVSQIKIAWFTYTLSDAPKANRYVLFPLHVMPEASLLGSTPELADQFSLIKNISINLPWGVRLCLKKHPEQNRWSGPSFDFYRKLDALKNVDVIAAEVPIGKILRDPNCIAVATINGTVGLEAVINRKPVFVFGRAIYGVADCFLKPNSFEDFRSQIMAISKDQFQFNEGAMWSILAALHAALWHGDDDFAFAKTREEAMLRSFSAFERYIRSEVWRKPESIRSEIGVYS